MIDYNKSNVRNSLTIDNIFSLLESWGGEPQRTNFGIVSATICHNPIGEGSRKLYFYENSGLFICYSGCAENSFDIFQLFIKVMKNQHGKEYDLNGAVRWIAQKFGISGIKKEDESDLEDWKILANYDRIQEISIQPNQVILKEYDKQILSNFNYNVRLTPWLNEGITQETLNLAQIGYYPGGDQITIPHFDKDGRFIGLRGRTLCQEDADKYGKYRPLKINNQLYNHPLGFNLYGLNWNKDVITLLSKAVIYESEKSVLKHESYFPQANMSVACCGSNITAHQIQLLMDLGVQEIILAFDRQFQKIGDDEYNKLKNRINNLKNKYKNYVNISCIWDKKMITGYKDAPIDCGPEVFLKLFKERIIL